jgi:3-hydroxyisobutyrate dehydrogenase
MAKLGLCGLGQMGTPMAGRLIDTGHQVTVWNRTAHRTRPLADRGATAAATPAEAAAAAEIVFTVDPGGDVDHRTGGGVWPAFEARS